MINMRCVKYRMFFLFEMFYIFDFMVYNGCSLREVYSMNKKKTVIVLFFTMMKIGLFTFGGGYAMIALLENEFIEKKKWIDKEEFLNMAAIAESTPGPIAINAATYVGYKVAGLIGSIVSTVAICIPSFLIIYIISLFFDKFLELEFIANAFKGIQVCVLYLILSAGVRLFKGMKKSLFNIILFFSVFVVMTAFSLFAVNFSTIYYILISGIIGMCSYFISLIIRDKKEGK